MKFNESIYGGLVSVVVNNKHDYFWLCNQLASAYKKLVGNVNNPRVSISSGGKWSQEYQKKLDAGCCSYYDKEIINPATSNKYWIGFNYNH